MKVLKRRTVTKESADGTFEVGDHLQFFENGDVGSIEGMGWIDKADFPLASVGMETKEDDEWAERRKRSLRKELERLCA